jgi:hypothetical protein
MRVLLGVIWLIGTLLAAAAAQAETRTFIVTGNADGYGVDRCLTTGASCGKAVAAAYCRAQAFDEALSFRRIERTEITAAVPTSTCRGLCEDLIAIECRR